MAKDWEPTEEDFNRFLYWLDQNRETAAQKYEKMRRNLIIFLNKRGCRHSEDLADRAFNSVMHQLPRLIDTYEGNPARYIAVVARNLYYREAQSETHHKSISDSDYPQLSVQPPSDDDDRDYICFEHCIQKLPLQSRALILEYYEKDKMEKIIHRRKMAERLGITPNALAIRIYRLREFLTSCIDECLKGNLAYEIN